MLSLQSAGVELSHALDNVYHNRPSFDFVPNLTLDL